MLALSPHSMSSKTAFRDNTASAVASSSKTKHKKLPKKVKPALSAEEQVEKRWKSIADQINDGYPRHALHNLKKSEQPQDTVSRTAN